MPVRFALCFVWPRGICQESNRGCLVFDPERGPMDSMRTTSADRSTGVRRLIDRLAECVELVFFSRGQPANERGGIVCLEPCSVFGFKAARGFPARYRAVDPQRSPAANKRPIDGFAAKSGTKAHQRLKSALRDQHRHCPARASGFRPLARPSRRGRASGPHLWEDRSERNCQGSVKCRGNVFKS